MPLAETTFLDFFWYMIVVSLWAMAIWLFIAVFADIFGRDDLSGWSKAAWTVLLVVLPFLGALIYLIARPKATLQDVRAATQMEAAQQAAAGVSTADELAKLGELRSQGVLSEQEYEELKRKALA